MNYPLLVRLYPRAWRHRYGEEFLALLEGQPASPRVVLDVVLGALDAHLRLQTPAPEPVEAAHTTPSPAPAPRGSAPGTGVPGALFYNLVVGLLFIHIEVVLRVVALCDPHLRAFLRDLTGTAASPGPFVVPKFLSCGPAPDAAPGPTLPAASRDGGRLPIVTTGIRRPLGAAYRPAGIACGLEP